MSWRTGEPVALDSRLALFVEGLLIERMDKPRLKLHGPQPQPPARQPLRGSHLIVV